MAFHDLCDDDITTTADEMASYLLIFPEKPKIRTFVKLTESLGFIRVNQAETDLAFMLYNLLETIDILHSSTVQSPRPKDIDNELLEIFSFANLDDFEDDDETEFSTRLLGFIDYYHGHAIDALSDYIKANPHKTDIIHEVMRLVGRSGDKRSQLWRRQFLEQTLFSHSSRIRYGAILGLAYMNDPASTDLITQALEEEKIEVLRNVLGQLLNQLENNV